MKRRQGFSEVHASIFVMLLTLPACSSEPTLAERVQTCLDETIAHGQVAYWVQGTWRIHGTGKRTGCHEQGLDTGAFELGSAAFRVHQSRYDIRVEPNASTQQAGASFTLDGTVGERCVRFVSTETRGEDVILYDFAAEFLNARTISGEFTGSGPLAGCHTEGNFVLSIDLDPLPAPIRVDAGTPGPSTDSGPDAVGSGIIPEASDGARPAQDGGSSTADAGAIDREADGAAADALLETADRDAPDASAADGDGPDATPESGSAADDKGDRDAGVPDAALADDATDAGNEAGYVAEDAIAPSADSAAAERTDFTYVLWDLSANATAQASADAKASCSVHPAHRTGPSFAPWAVLGIALASRRRRGSAASKASAR